MPDEIARAGHRAHAALQLWQLVDDLLVQVRQHALDAPELVTFKREHETDLEALQYARIEVGGGLA